MTTTLPSPYAPFFFFFLLGCTPSAPPPPAPQPAQPAPTAPEPIEEWKREAFVLQKEIAARPPNPWNTFPRDIADLLDNPDPPPQVGPEVKILPAGNEAIEWPAPKEGVLTVRYRIERKDCGAGGSDMGCHLVALCPIEAPPGTAPLAEQLRSEFVGPQTLIVGYVEALEVPSPKCELRLYARDHHGSKICNTRGPKLPASWSGAAVVDVGTIGLDGVKCERDTLADRMMFRQTLTVGWRSRNAKKP
jgi:hypothetical protein